MKKDREEPPEGMRVEYGTTIYRYRGYDIRFNDNSDMWACSDLNVEHIQLSVVKEMIGKLDAQGRKLDGIPVLILTEHSPSITPGSAVLVDVDQKGIWVNHMEKNWRTGKEALKRDKKSLESICDDTPENRAKLQECIDLTKQERDIAAQRRQTYASIPRFKMPDTRVAEALPEETSQRIAERPIRTRTRR